MKQLLLIFSVVMPVLAFADEPPATGTHTRAWVELQKSGEAAAAAPRPMAGEVADKVYERYLQSYAHPIPQRMDREGFVGAASGGSSR